MTIKIENNYGQAADEMIIINKTDISTLCQHCRTAEISEFEAKSDCPFCPKCRVDLANEDLWLVKGNHEKKKMIVGFVTMFLSLLSIGIYSKFFLTSPIVAASAVSLILIGHVVGFCVLWWRERQAIKCVADFYDVSFG